MKRASKHYLQNNNNSGYRVWIGLWDGPGGSQPMFETLLGSKLDKESEKTDENGRFLVFLWPNLTWKSENESVFWALETQIKHFGVPGGSIWPFWMLWRPFGYPNLTKKVKKRTKTGVFWSFWGLEMVQNCFEMDKIDQKSLPNCSRVPY